MTTMEEIILAGHNVAAAYTQLLAASDALASLMEYDRDVVLRHVLTAKVNQRRNQNRVLDYLETEYDAIERHLKDAAKVRAQTAARQELLGKLNLSAAEMKLLGIES